MERKDVAATLGVAREMRLLSTEEVDEVMAAFGADSPFVAALRHADSMHVHVKVDATEALPRAALEAAGGTVENEKAGYVKLSFPSGMNLIFSSIPVSEDERRGAEAAKRPKPFLDHYGIDMRRDAADVRDAFDGSARAAESAGWRHVGQGGSGKAVFCCHVSVSEKHWLFPRDGGSVNRAPVELPFGPLTVQADKSGCDLRPSDPLTATGSCAPSGCAPKTCGG